ncbi:hypothetical protein KA001_00595 [Patescibacteria group bacterium]|nr:hypothetical protein [Patescibacteria group bacterium]
MSKLAGKYKGHNFHGSPERFDEVADFVVKTFGRNIRYIADVAGGQGMLTRILRKKYNYECEVVDPRGYALVGVPSKKEEYTREMATMYDLVIGLHPDEATTEVVYSAFKTPTLIIPCCNFWDKTQKLGTKELVEAIETFYKKNGIRYKIVKFDFKSPKNIGILTLTK